MNKLYGLSYPSNHLHPPSLSDQSYEKKYNKSVISIRFFGSTNFKAICEDAALNGLF